MGPARRAGGVGRAAAGRSARSGPPRTVGGLRFQASLGRVSARLIAREVRRGQDGLVTRPYFTVTLWIGLPLALLSAWSAVVVRDLLPIPMARYCGGGFLFIGSLNVVFFRQLGRRIYTQSQSGPPF